VKVDGAGRRPGARTSVHVRPAANLALGRGGATIPGVLLPSLAGVVASLALAQAPGACAVTSVTGLAFGAYDAIAVNRTTPLDTTGQLAYRCRGVTALVTLSAGGGGSGFAPRRLQQGAQRLGYNLYLDAARTQIWGDGTAGTQTYLAPRGRNTLVIYGRVFPGQTPPAGTYSDTIVATLNF
jgi:spore coat protein U-like protein